MGRIACACLFLLVAVAPSAEDSCSTKTRGLLFRRKGFDDALVERAKRDYLAVLKGSPESPREAGEPPIQVPRTPEAKIALVEAVAELSISDADPSPVFAHIKREGRRILLRLLGRWRDAARPLPGRRLERLMDAHYFEMRRKFFRLLRPLPLLPTAEDLETLSRMRWEHEVVKARLRTGLEREGIASYVESPVLDGTKVTLKTLFYLYINYVTFNAFHIPLFFPPGSLYGTRANRAAARAAVASIDRIGSGAAYEQFRDNFANIDAFESYKDQARAIYPLFVAGFIVGYLSWMQFMAAKEIENGTLPNLRDVDTRGMIERDLVAAMSAAYRQHNSTEPSPEQLEAFRRSLGSVEITLLNRIRERYRRGDDGPVVRLIDRALD